MGTINELRPIQPRFVLGTDYYYKKTMPCAPFSHFYQFQRHDTDGWVMAMPDAAMDIIFECTPNGSTARLLGMGLQNWRIALKRNTTYFGVRFLPGYIPKPLRTLFPRLIQTALPLGWLGMNYPGFAEISSMMDFPKKIATFFDAFTEGELRDDRDALFLELLKLIYQSEGNISVETLEKKSGYCRRYINKVFNKNAGVSPKAFCVTVKFQWALLRMNCGDYRSLAELALTLGYGDQAKFCNDFKRFTLLTPKQYAALIDKEKYSNLIQNF